MFESISELERDKNLISVIIVANLTPRIVRSVENYINRSYIFKKRIVAKKYGKLACA